VREELLEKEQMQRWGRLCVIPLFRVVRWSDKGRGTRESFCAVARSKGSREMPCITHERLQVSYALSRCSLHCLCGYGHTLDQISLVHSGIREGRSLPGPGQTSELQQQSGADWICSRW
jgi:hypothetical protein